MSRASQKMRAHRRSRNPKITLEEFGRRYGVTGTAVHFWESGRSYPAPGIIKRLQADGICEPADWYEDAEAESSALTSAAE